MASRSHHRYHYHQGAYRVNLSQAKLSALMHYPSKHWLVAGTRQEAEVEL